MVNKFAVVGLLAVVLAMTTDLSDADEDKPTFAKSNSDIENKWSDKCDKVKKDRRSVGNSPGHNDEDGDDGHDGHDGNDENDKDGNKEKSTMCPLWELWEAENTGECKVQGACEVLVLNKISNKDFVANSQSCTGDCPAGSRCVVDSKFCANNQKTFPCQPDSYTKNGKLENVFTCQLIPTTTATTTTTTTPTTTTTAKTTSTTGSLSA